jgi:hypothetical protein
VVVAGTKSSSGAQVYYDAKLESLVKHPDKGGSPLNKSAGLTFG